MRSGRPIPGARIVVEGEAAPHVAGSDGRFEAGSARRRSTSPQCLGSWLSDMGRDHPASQRRHCHHTPAGLHRRARRRHRDARRGQRSRSSGGDQRPVVVRSVAFGLHRAGRCAEDDAGIQPVSPHLVEDRQSDRAGRHAARVVRVRRVACDRAGGRDSAERSVWWLGVLGSRAARRHRAGGRGPRRQQRSLWRRCGRRRDSDHHGAAHHARGKACPRWRLDRDGTRVNAHGVVGLRRSRAVRR